MNTIELRIRKVTLFIFIAAYSALSMADDAVLNAWKISKIEYFKETSNIPGLEIERSAVLFENGKRYVLPLERAKPISVLKGNDGSYYLLAQGADCTACDEHNALRFYELGGTELKFAKHRYEYPGRLYEEDSLLQETRVFYGRCLNKPGDVVIWYLKYLGKDSKWHKSNTIFRVAKGGDVIVELNEKEANQASVLAAVNSGACKELPGVDDAPEE